jgi:hypothetical protein
MSATIGSVSCHFLKGPIHAPESRLAEWSIPGLDGVGLMDLGLGPRRSELTAIYFGSASACNSWLESLVDLVGANALTVTNDIGETDSDCIVVSVRRVSVQAAKPTYDYKYTVAVTIIAGASGQ